MEKEKRKRKREKKRKGKNCHTFKTCHALGYKTKLKTPASRLSYPFYPAKQFFNMFEWDATLKTCNYFLSTIKEYYHVEQSEISIAFFFPNC